MYEPTVQLARNECILPPPYYNYLQPESHEMITTAEEVCDHAYVSVYSQQRSQVPITVLYRLYVLTSCWIVAVWSGLKIVVVFLRSLWGWIRSKNVVGKIERNY